MPFDQFNEKPGAPDRRYADDILILWWHTGGIVENAAERSHGYLEVT